MTTTMPESGEFSGESRSLSGGTPSAMSVSRRDRVENPLTVLRNENRLTVDGLARRSNVGRQVIMRSEQAVFTDPPDKILDTLLRLSPEYDRAEALAGYYAFQRATRRYNFGRLDPDVDFALWAAHDIDEHPFVWWRCTSGIEARIQVSKLYCVHPAVIFKFEMQPYLMKSLPSQLVDALLESGYRDTVIDALAGAYTRYKRYLSSQVAVSDFRHSNRQTA